MLTHEINGIRNTVINKIIEAVCGRKDFKIDCIFSKYEDWKVSW